MLRSISLPSRPMTASRRMPGPISNHLRGSGYCFGCGMAILAMALFSSHLPGNMFQPSPTHQHSQRQRGPYGSGVGGKAKEITECLECGHDSLLRRNKKPIQCGWAFADSGNLKKVYVHTSTPAWAHAQQQAVPRPISRMHFVDIVNRVITRIEACQTSGTNNCDEMDARRGKATTNQLPYRGFHGLEHFQIWCSPTKAIAAKTCHSERGRTPESKNPYLRCVRQTCPDTVTSGKSSLKPRPHSCFRSHGVLRLGRSPSLSMTAFGPFSAFGWSTVSLKMD